MPRTDNESNQFALMMHEDTIASLTPESTREERIATAHALIEAGSSINLAATITGLPARTLWDRINGGSRTTEQKEELIEKMAIEAVLQGSLKILARFEDGSMRPAEEIKALQVMRDTVAKRRKWDTPAIEMQPEKRSALRDLIEALQKASTDELEVVTNKEQEK